MLKCILYNGGSSRDQEVRTPTHPSPKPRMFNVYVESGKKKRH